MYLVETNFGDFTTDIVDASVMHRLCMEYTSVLRKRGYKLGAIKFIYRPINTFGYTALRSCINRNYQYERTTRTTVSEIPLC